MKVPVNRRKTVMYSRLGTLNIPDIRERNNPDLTRVSVIKSRTVSPLLHSLRVPTSGRRDTPTFKISYKVFHLKDQE